MEIWINPQCSKCRGALAFLDEHGAEYTVRRYLEDVPGVEELAEILERLGLEPWDITRTGEQVAKDLGMSGWGKAPRGSEEGAADRARWIAALAEHPILIQRPIITADDGHAVVGRSEEALREAVGG